ncbi:MAG: hypothetical protein QG585_205 [Patescibacteria group bacterium]|jgi:hypothetical protein|nr:hypothetical protein [Patescibacteria group bacterium]
MDTYADPVLLQDKMIRLVLEQFADKPPRFGQFPIHPAFHSIRVGLDLIKYGFPLPVCLGGSGHDFDEETDLNMGVIYRDFGQMVTVYIQMTSLHPRFNGEHTDESENELFERVKVFVETTGDIGPLAIKSVDSMDSVRGAKYCPADWAPKLLKRAERWLALARPYLSRDYNDLVLDFAEVIRRESLRINYPVPTDAKPQH